MNWDSEQEAAITTAASRALVIASPGAGKTTVLMGRVRHMIHEQRITPSRIALTTFTRYAAAQMRERLPQSCQGVNISTLHAFALRIIMEYGEGLGYERDWLSIASEEDMKLDEREVLCDLGLIAKKPGGKWEWRKVKARDWQEFRDGLTNGSLTRKDAQEKHPDLWKAWEALRARFKAQNVLTFGLILYEAWTLLQDRKVLKHYRERYRHFLVDEGQDMSKMEWSILMRFIQAAEPHTIFIVSDPRQSIYEWRGGVPQIMIDFAGAEDTTVYELPNCYRFGPEIATTANNLISYNPQRLGQPINPKGQPGKIEIREDVTLQQVAMELGVITKVDNVPPQDIAVLCRKHAPLEVLKKELEARGVPCRKIGRLAALRNAAEFRACMGYLRLAVNPRDDQAFMAVTAVEGISEGQILDLRAEALARRCSIYEAHGKTEAWPKTVEGLQRYLLNRDPHGDYEPALEFLTIFEYTEGCSSVQDLIIRLSLSTVQDEMKQVTDEVTLASIHAMKGCQAPIIYVIGMNDDIFPSPMSIREGRLEEEVRLCYVAVSRAERELHLIHIKDDGPGQQRWQKISGAPSPFLGMTEKPFDEAEGE